MSEHRWEWILPGGERVHATLDPASGIESVLVGDRLACRGARGSRPEGYVVALTDPPAEVVENERVVVTFDARLVICVLRVGNEEIAPSRWPEVQRKKAPPPAPRSSSSLAIALVGALLALAVAGGGAVYVLRARASTGDPNATMTGVHRASNGLFVAHFPPSFTAKPAVTPSGMSGLVLEDKGSGDAIVLVALASGDGLGDPWALQKRVHGEALANLPRGNGAYDETSRSDGTCLGQAGALVMGRVTSISGGTAKLWSCAFHRGRAAYLAMYSVADSRTAVDAKHLQSVIDATELTELEDIGGRLP